MKWANENAVPKWAAIAADWSLEPSSHTSGRLGPVGIASTRAKGCSGGSVPLMKPSTSAIFCGKSSTRGMSPDTSALAVIWSLPGARPMPRSMRPG